ncbi:MAG: hypothetical protein CSA05_00720 [Bacteroidia bacterium]|nr:MAG: hypothetical protein CSB01_00475 [Bacteroidia bacterium]PIE86420.1 MAG: hypothetical protein CSA05_00720 [Bacteroidia bacterium]
MIYWKKELAIEKQLGLKREYAATLSSLGILNRQIGRLDTAITYLSKSLELEKKFVPQNEIYIANIYHQIGIAYIEKLEHNLALENLNESLRLHKKHKENISSYEFGKLYNSFAICYARKNDFEKSLSYHEKALKFRKDSTLEQASTYQNMAISYINLNKLKLGIDLLEKAIEINIKFWGKAHLIIGDLYGNLGSAYGKKGSHKIAISYFQKAIEIKEKALREGRYTDIANEYFGLALSNEKLGYTDKCFEYLQKALYANSNNFSDTLNLNSYPSFSNNIDKNLTIQIANSKGIFFLQKYEEENNKADLHSAYKAYLYCDTVIEKLRKTVTSQKDKLEIGKNAFAVYENAIKTCFVLYKLTKEVEYSQKAFYFSEKNRARVLTEELTDLKVKKTGNIPDSLLKKEYKLKIDISNCQNLIHSAKTNDDLATIDSLQFAASREFDKLQTQIRESYPSYYKLFKIPVVSTQKLQTILDNKTAILEYFVGDNSVYSMLIAKNKIELFMQKKDPHFDEKINTYRQLIYSFSHEIQLFARKSHEVYNMIFKPIENHLKNIEHLIIIPDGILNIMPFESLVFKMPAREPEDYAELDYLIQNMQISNHYSATLYVENKLQKKQNFEYEFTGFAMQFSGDSGIVYEKKYREYVGKMSAMPDDDYQPLRETSRTIKKIAEIYDRNQRNNYRFTGQNATEQNFRKMKSSRIFQLSTHSFPNNMFPDKSYIAFEKPNAVTNDNNDGKLYFHEIYNMKLHADLMIIHSCMSGLGHIQRGEGVLSLPRAFVHAGIPNIIYTPWEIMEKNLKETLILFHENVISGDSYNLSLYKAKLRAIKNKLYPGQWAGLLLIEN